jgi:hypothetical protein
MRGAIVLTIVAVFLLTLIWRAALTPVDRFIVKQAIKRHLWVLLLIIVVVVFGSYTLAVYSLNVSAIKFL